MHNQEISVAHRTELIANAIDEINSHNKSIKHGALHQKDYDHFLESQFNQPEQALQDSSAYVSASSSAAQQIVDQFARNFEQAGFILIKEDDNSISLVLHNIQKATDFIVKMPDSDDYSVSKVFAAVSKTVAPMVRSLAEIGDEEYFQNDIEELKK